MSADINHSHDEKRAEKSDDATGFGFLEQAIRELCNEKGYFSAEDHRRFVEFMEGLKPENGSRLVAKTWTDPEFKKRLLEDATKACELTDWKGPNSLGTLAAAYAEAGQFDKAVEWQQKATDLAPESEKADYGSRLKLYQEGKPYREEPTS